MRPVAWPIHAWHSDSVEFVPVNDLGELQFKFPTFGIHYLKSALADCSSGLSSFLSYFLLQQHLERPSN